LHTGNFHRTGYGRIFRDKKWRWAHRIAWEDTIGPIPEGLCVLHKCDVSACVNPNHLFVGTQQDNIDDMIQKGRKKTKLKPVDVLRIRELRQQGHTFRVIADMFNLKSGVTVFNIISGKSWRLVR
jgi:hypothetical protein